MNVNRSASVGAAPASDPHLELRRMSHAMESLFLNQLFQAMRASVPQESATDGPAADVFTGMLDEQIAGLSAGHSPRGLGEALYHQLARRLDALSAGATDEKGK